MACCCGYEYMDRRASLATVKEGIRQPTIRGMFGMMAGIYSLVVSHGGVGMGRCGAWLKKHALACEGCLLQWVANLTTRNPMWHRC